MIRILSALILIFMVGCDEQSIMHKFASPEDQAIAMNYIGLLRARDFAPIEQDTDPSIKNPNLHDILVKMADQIPGQDPISVKIVGYKTLKQVMNGSDNSTTNIVFEYEFPG